MGTWAKLAAAKKAAGEPTTTAQIPDYAYANRPVVDNSGPKATAAQIAYIIKLMGREDEGGFIVRSNRRLEDLTRSQASALIESLKGEY